MTARSSGLTPSSSGISGKTAAPSGTSSGSAASLISASRHRRNDGQVVAVLDRGLQVVEVANVLVVEEQVDEAAQLAVVEEPARQGGKAGGQVVEDGLDGAPLGLHRGLALGVAAHGARDLDLDRHGCSSR